MISPVQWQLGQQRLCFVLTIFIRLSYAGVAQWINPRAAIIRDVAIVEGGFLTTGDFDGKKWSSGTQTPPAEGLLYNISLCNSFDIEANDTYKLLNSMEEDGSPTGQIWIGGGLFVNNVEFYAFG